MRESLPMSLGNTDNDYRLNCQFNGIMLIDDDDELESENEYEKVRFICFDLCLLIIDLIKRIIFSTDGNMQTSIHSIIPDGSDNFFTIDESYCPKIQNYPLNFDDIIRQTLWYYVENVN